MNENKILDTLQDIFRDVFADDNIKIDRGTNANDIEDWDSLNHIVLLEAVQGEYGITFEIDDIIDMKNVGDIVDAIMNKISNRAV